MVFLRFRFVKKISTSETMKIRAHMMWGARDTMRDVDILHRFICASKCSRPHFGLEVLRREHRVWLFRSIKLHNYHVVAVRWSMWKSYVRGKTLAFNSKTQLIFPFHFKFAAVTESAIIHPHLDTIKTRGSGHLLSSTFPSRFNWR